MQRFTALPLLVVLLLAPHALAGNWAHWRGPEGNGVAPQADPPTHWSATENVKWKAEIPGRSSGSPVVWNDQVFVVTAVGGQQASEDSRGQRRGRRGGASLSELQFRLLCVDRASGKIRWQQTAVVATPHQATHSTNGFASASPCTDGTHVYAHFGSRGLYCYTMDGELKWKRDDLGRMETRNDFGEGSSPTLIGDMIIVPWDHEGPSCLFALDKSTGETIWKADRDEPTCWATPLIVEHDGRKQIVMNGQNSARGYDLETGKELWRCGGQTDRPVASPVAAGGLVFVGSGFRGAFLGAFRLDGSGDIEGTDRVVWQIDRNTPDVPSLLLSDGRIYFFRQRSNLFTCLEAATGKIHYSERIPGLSEIYASPIAAGGHVYLTDRDGTTVVIEDSKELKVVATNSVGETVDSTPAPVDDQLYVRGERHLFRIQQ